MKNIFSLLHIIFFSLLGGGRATKEQIALAIFLLFGFATHDSLSGACVSPNQENGGKYCGGAYCNFLFYNMLAVEFAAIFLVCGLQYGVFVSAKCVGKHDIANRGSDCFHSLINLFFLFTI